MNLLNFVITGQMKVIAMFDFFRFVLLCLCVIAGWEFGWWLGS